MVEGAGEGSSGGGVEVWVIVAVLAVVLVMGEVFVGPQFMKVVISEGVLAGVTLSMNCQDGSSRTEVLWSEWLGIGMSEAESMRRWSVG